jgi:hypothetical protein
MEKYVIRLVPKSKIVLFQPYQSFSVRNRVTRRFIFKPKIQISSNFGGPEIGKFWYILWSFGIHLAICTDIRDILWPFGTFWVHLYIFSGFGIMCKEKICQPLSEMMGKIVYPSVPYFFPISLYSKLFVLYHRFHSDRIISTLIFGSPIY